MFSEFSWNAPQMFRLKVPRAALRERRAQREEERLRAVERKVQLLEKGSRDTRRGTWLFLSLLFVLIYLNCGAGAAPQPGVAALDGALDFCFILFLIVFVLAPQQGVATPEGAPDFIIINIIIIIINILFEFV